MENFEFNIVQSEKSRTMKPQIAEIAEQLEASEDNYAKALIGLDSEDKGIREEAMIYLSRHRDYLIDAADTFVRVGFDNPEERDAESEVKSRLGIILDKLEEHGA